jgi:hypothetical protein
LNQTCNLAGAIRCVRQKSPLFDASNREENAMIASYQFIINVIAEYIEIVMLSIGMMVFLASE